MSSTVEDATNIDALVPSSESAEDVAVAASPQDAATDPASPEVSTAPSVDTNAAAALIEDTSEETEADTAAADVDATEEQLTTADATLGSMDESTPQSESKPVDGPTETAEDLGSSSGEEAPAVTSAEPLQPENDKGSDVDVQSDVKSESSGESKEEASTITDVAVTSDTPKLDDTVVPSAESVAPAAPNEDSPDAKESDELEDAPKDAAQVDASTPLPDAESPAQEAVSDVPDPVDGGLAGASRDNVADEVQDSEEAAKDDEQTPMKYVQDPEDATPTEIADATETLAAKHIEAAAEDPKPESALQDDSQPPVEVTIQAQEEVQVDDTVPEAPPADTESSPPAETETVPVAEPSTAEPAATEPSASETPDAEPEPSPAEPEDSQTLDESIEKSLVVDEESATQEPLAEESNATSDDTVLDEDAPAAAKVPQTIEANEHDSSADDAGTTDLVEEDKAKADETAPVEPGVELDSAPMEEALSAVEPDVEPAPVSSPDIVEPDVVPSAEVPVSDQPEVAEAVPQPDDIAVELVTAEGGNEVLADSTDDNATSSLEEPAALSEQQNMSEQDVVQDAPVEPEALPAVETTPVPELEIAQEEKEQPLVPDVEVVAIPAVIDEPDVVVEDNPVTTEQAAATDEAEVPEDSPDTTEDGAIPVMEVNEETDQPSLADPTTDQSTGQARDESNSLPLVESLPPAPTEHAAVDQPVADSAQGDRDVAVNDEPASGTPTREKHRRRHSHTQRDSTHRSSRRRESEASTKERPSFPGMAFLAAAKLAGSTKTKRRDSMTERDAMRGKDRVREKEKTSSSSSKERAYPEHQSQRPRENRGEDRHSKRRSPEEVEGEAERRRRHELRRAEKARLLAEEEEAQLQERRERRRAAKKLEEERLQAEEERRKTKKNDSIAREEEERRIRHEKRRKRHEAEKEAERQEREKILKAEQDIEEAKRMRRQRRAERENINRPLPKPDVEPVEVSRDAARRAAEEDDEDIAAPPPPSPPLVPVESPRSVPRRRMSTRDPPPPVKRNSLFGGIFGRSKPETTPPISKSTKSGSRIRAEPEEVLQTSDQGQRREKVRPVSSHHSPNEDRENIERPYRSRRYSSNQQARRKFQSAEEEEEYYRRKEARRSMRPKEHVMSGGRDGVVSVPEPLDELPPPPPEPFEFDDPTPRAVSPLIDEAAAVVGVPSTSSGERHERRRSKRVSTMDERPKSRRISVNERERPVSRRIESDRPRTRGHGEERPRPRRGETEGRSSGSHRKKKEETGGLKSLLKRFA